MRATLLLHFSFLAAVMLASFVMSQPPSAGAVPADSGIFGPGAEAITAGDYHACTLKSGAVWCWGRNNLGQLGNNSLTNSSIPVAVTGMTSGVTAVAAGGNHTCALKDGGAWCWGWNIGAQLGTGNTTSSQIPVAVSGLSSGVTAITAGNGHSCAVKSGAAFCWGDNSFGQLGRGAIVGDQTIPAAVPNLSSGAGSITAGEFHTCALKGDAAWCWGANGAGQLGIGTAVDSHIAASVHFMTLGVSALSAGGAAHTCAVRFGAALCWGANDFGQLGDDTTTQRLEPVAVSGLTSGVTAIGIGDKQSCAVKDGGASCWGRNRLGQLGIGVSSGPHFCLPFESCSRTPQPLPGLSAGVTIVAGGGADAALRYHNCALKNGSVWCWGSNFYGQLGDPDAPDPSIAPFPQTETVSGGATAISASGFHSCLVEYGGLSCWGRNLEGQLGNTSHNGPFQHVVPAGMEKGVSAVSVSGYQTCAIKDGAAWCWGKNNFGQLGNGTTDDSPVPVAVTGLSSGVTAIASGFGHTCAVKDTGAWCWGQNQYGKLGDGTTDDSTVPVQVSGFTTGVMAISASVSHTCAIWRGGAWCWGRNVEGQLGDGTTDLSHVPVQVDGFGNGAGVTDITVGSFHTCAVKNAAAFCWGENSNGRLGNNSTTGSLIPVTVTGLTAGATSISAGDAHTCAVQDGDPFCWGANFVGQLGTGDDSDSLVPVPVTGVTGSVNAISSGYGHNCGLNNGAAVCWGRNVYAELGDNTTTDSPAAVSVYGDNDGDRCLDAQETQPSEAFGGDRDPMDFWDFYDVDDNRAIDLNDTLAILGKFGLIPGEAGYDPTYDRIAGPVDEPWRNAQASGDALGIDLQDALANLQSFGHSCTNPP